MLLPGERLDDGGGRANEVGGEKIRGTNDLASLVEAGERQHLLDDGRQMLRDRTHALEHVELLSDSGPMT